MTIDEKVSLDFGAFVPFYERVVDPLTLPIGLRALDLIGTSRGDKVIDVAAGTGALALEIAKRGAQILATDIAPGMVARAACRLAPFDGAEARVMSFDALDAPDASFDAALSIVGVLTFSEGNKGLRELVRVTRPGGQVVVATWDQEQTAAPQYLAGNVFAELFPRRNLWPDDFFPAWPKDAVVTALRDAGCARAEVRTAEGEWTVTSPAKVMEESGATIRMFPGYRALKEAERKSFENAFTRSVISHAGPDGVSRLVTRAFIAIGHLPE